MTPAVELGHRRRVLWYGYLAGGALLKAYLIIRFVNNLWVA